MKKWMTIVVAGAMALALTACGAGDVGSSEYMANKEAASKAATSSQSAKSSVAEVKYEDTLSGLQSYLKAKGVVSGDAMTMQADLIGATSGVKYVYSYEGKQNVTLELYEFNPKVLKEKGQETLNNVKKFGSFTIMERNVPAVLSDNQKYLLIYADKDSGDKHEARQKEVKDIFMAFQK